MEIGTIKSIGPPEDGISAFDGVGKIDIMELTRTI
jgi:hypothetical protein